MRLSFSHVDHHLLILPPPGLGACRVEAGEVGLVLALSRVEVGLVLPAAKARELAQALRAPGPGFRRIEDLGTVYLGESAEAWVHVSREGRVLLEVAWRASHSGPWVELGLEAPREEALGWAQALEEAAQVSEGERAEGAEVAA